MHKKCMFLQGNGPRGRHVPPLDQLGSSFFPCSLERMRAFCGMLYLPCTVSDGVAWQPLIVTISRRTWRSSDARPLDGRELVLGGTRIRPHNLLGELPKAVRETVAFSKNRRHVEMASSLGKDGRFRRTNDEPRIISFASLQSCFCLAATAPMGRLRLLRVRDQLQRRDATHIIDTP